MNNTDDCMIVAIYGTLRSRCSNHHLLVDLEATLIEANIEIAGLEIRIDTLSQLPFAIQTYNDQDRLIGELYAIHNKYSKQLDRFEGEGTLYHRTLVKTITGQPCFIYLGLTSDYGFSLINSFSIKKDHISDYYESKVFYFSGIN